MFWVGGWEPTRPASSWPLTLFLGTWGPTCHREVRVLIRRENSRTEQCSESRSLALLSEVHSEGGEQAGKALCRGCGGREGGPGQGRVAHACVGHGTRLGRSPTEAAPSHPRSSSCRTGRSFSLLGSLVELSWQPSPHGGRSRGRCP